MKTLTKKQEARVELFNSVSWLCMDACWMFSIKFLCYTFIVPTVITGLLLFIFVKGLTIKMANLGILSWSLMNIFWMCSEFFEESRLMNVAYACFFIGSGLIAYSVLSNPQLKRGLFKRMGAFRSFVKKGQAQRRRR